MAFVDEDGGILYRGSGRYYFNKKKFPQYTKAWFAVRDTPNSVNRAYISINKNISVPMSWLGKKIRLRAEIIKDDAMVLNESIEIRQEKILEEYSLDTSSIQVYLCVKCKQEKECYYCSNCENWYCKRHLSLQEVDRNLCDECYIKLDLRKMTIGDTPDQKIKDALDRMKDDKSNIS